MKCNAEMRLLISRHADGETHGDEAARAERHLGTCAGCRALMLEWAEQRDLFTWAHSRAHPVEADAMALVRVASGSPGRSASPRQMRPRLRATRRAWLWASAAACATVAAVALSYRASLPPMLAATADGRTTAELRLASGVRLELGPDAKVTRLGARKVRLDGGWLRVDVRRGNIVVRTKRMDVRDIGTRFQVTTSQKADTVFVEAGAVVVRHGSARTLVARDQLLSVGDNGELTVAGFPAWTKEEDAQGQSLAGGETFVPGSAGELEWRAGLKRLAARFPDLRASGGSELSSYIQDGREYAFRRLTLSGLRAGLRAHMPELAAWMSGDTSHVGVWSVPVTLLGLEAPSDDGSVSPGVYRLDLIATGHDLLWRLSDGDGASTDLPAIRESKLRSGSFSRGAAGNIAYDIEHGKRHEMVVQILDWPGDVKPTLRFPLQGRPVAEARADVAPLLASMRQATARVPGLKMSLAGSTANYLDAERQHYLLWAENRAGESFDVHSMTRGSSWLAGAVQANVAWVSPRAPAGTYLLWLVWPSGKARPHWEMSSLDGARRWVLEVAPELEGQPAQASKGRLPDRVTLSISRSTEAENGAFGFGFGFHAIPSPGIQGGGRMSLAAP